MNNGSAQRKEVDAEALASSLPQALLDSEEPGVLVRILAKKLMELDTKIHAVMIWPMVDVLPEALLDILAGDMHIDWYDFDADIAVKRTIIKAGVAVHKRLGTYWAVQRVITDYFGAGEVREWYTYGGEPHHFKVVSGNAEMVGVNLDRFVSMLNHVKRCSSWLDSVEIGLAAENTLYTAVAYAEHDVEAIQLGAITEEAAVYGRKRAASSAAAGNDSAASAPSEASGTANLEKKITDKVKGVYYGGIYTE